MKKEKFQMHGWRPLAGTAAASAMTVMMIFCATGCMTSLDSKKTKSSGTAVASPAKLAAEPKSLSGAELYAVNCNRCHPERSPVERTAGEWKTILIHMRVRANLPAAQANAILAYLQANSGE